MATASPIPLLYNYYALLSIRLTHRLEHPTRASSGALSEPFSIIRSIRLSARGLLSILLSFLFDHHPPKHPYITTLATLHATRTSKSLHYMLHVPITLHVSCNGSPADTPILDWWRANENTYPVLSSMAFDILAVPAISAECERMFSAANRSISSARARTHSDFAEASQCLRAWVLADLVELKASTR